MTRRETDSDPETLGTAQAELERAVAPAAALEELAEYLNVLGDSERVKVWLLLGSREFCVADLAAVVGVTVTAAAQHLSKLKRCGLIAPHRDSAAIYWGLSGHPLNRQLKELLPSLDTLRVSDS